MGPVTIGLTMALIALAVLAGGISAFWKKRDQLAMAPLRSFAVIAAASIALLHLLPEAISAVGFRALFATVAAMFVPTILERAFSHSHDGHDHSHEGHGFTELILGYAAVVTHQVGEGAAVASLARAGELSLGVVLAIAGHTVPLAMVVAMRVMEIPSRSSSSNERRPVIPAFMALLGIFGATSIGVSLGTLLDTDSLERAEPWLLAVVAGILLHALSHDLLRSPAATGKARIKDMVAGLFGLAIAMLGAHEHEPKTQLPFALRTLGCALIISTIVLRTVFVRARGEAR